MFMFLYFKSKLLQLFLNCLITPYHLYQSHIPIITSHIPIITSHNLIITAHSHHITVIILFVVLAINMLSNINNDVLLSVINSEKVLVTKEQIAQFLEEEFSDDFSDDGDDFELENDEFGDDDNNDNDFGDGDDYNQYNDFELENKSMDYNQALSMLYIYIFYILLHVRSIKKFVYISLISSNL